jgi:hypothetical protein
MASLVNPSNINGNFPIAGQDNDSQGFRDNFTNIRNNFTFIKSEVEDLQAKSILKSALIGGVLDNNFLGSQLKNAQLKNYAETMYDWGTTSGDIQLDLALGNVHKIYTSGSVQINAVIKNWPASLQYARVLLYIQIQNTAHTLSIPNTITTETAAIPGLRKITGNFTINFIDASSYIYEFSSVDSGSTIFVRELTRGNHLFRDPNFYLDGIGASSGYTVPTLKLSWGNSVALASTLDTAKSGTDSLSVRGSVTSYWAYNNASSTTTDGYNDPSLLGSPGFSVARSRIADPGAGASITTTSVNYVRTGDFLGGFNALGFANNYATTSGFYQLGAMNFYANGVGTNGIGGNIVISTKQPGTDGLKAAMVIDSGQNVTITGNLIVNGDQTVINTSTLNVEDKSIVMALGAATTLAANGAGIAVDGVYANIEYHYAGATTAVSTYGGGDRWISNKAFAIANSAASSSSTTGALVVAGGLGIGGDLNVGGTFGLTSSTNSTSKDTGAFVLASGGLGVELNITAGGGIFANSTSISYSTSSGALVTAGGAGIAGRLNVGGNVIISSATDTTGTTSGALIVSGGLNVAKSIIANTGPIIFGDTTNSSYIIGTTGTALSGAVRIHGGVHVAKTIMAGDDTDGTTPRIIVNGPAAGSMDATLTEYSGTNFARPTGAVWLGNTTAAVGMTVSGSLVLGSQTSGALYIRSTKSALGTVTNTIPTPYVPTFSGSGFQFGAATILGGTNIFGDLYVGQPSTNNSLTVKSGAGNIYVQSGALSTGISTGAIVIQKVTLADGVSTAAGGMAMQGNLYAVGNVYLGGDGSGSVNSNVVAAATTVSTSTTTGALVVAGGLGVAGRINTSSNLVITSSTAGSGTAAASATGALVLTAGGAYVDGITVIRGNVVLTAATAGSSTTSATLVITGSGGLGVGGVIRSGGQVVISDTTAGSSGGGALLLSGAGAGASIAGNLFVQGVTQPINAVGASGVALLSAAATDFNTAVATATDVTNLNFTAEANKTYKFEAILFHDTNATTNKSFMATFGAGTCSWLVETNTSASGALSSVNAYTLSAQAQAVSVSGSSNANQFARITGTFYHTVATNVKIQAMSSAGTGTLVIRGSSFLKWTKLN